MFGIIVAGRLVQTDAQQVEQTKFLFTIGDADNVNHIVVFMTGQTPFPDGLGGAVYFSWPSSSGQAWQLLGFISNNKPSAIFKIANLKSADTTGTAHPFGPGLTDQNHLAQIGISVEALDQLAQQSAAVNTSVSTVETFVEYSQKMLENLYNYAASFALSQAQMTPNPLESFVPMSFIQNWYQIFQRKLQQNPYFWRS